MSLRAVTAGRPVDCVLQDVAENFVRGPRGEAANINQNEGVAADDIDQVARAVADRTEVAAANGHGRRPLEGDASAGAVTRQIAAGTVDDVSAPTVRAGRSVRRREGVPNAAGRDQLPVRADDEAREPSELADALMHPSPSARVGRIEPVLAHVAAPEPAHGSMAAMTTGAAAITAPGYAMAPADRPPVNGATAHELSAARDGSGEVLPQIVKAMHLQWRDGGGEARIRLEPEHLGEVTVSLRVRDGAVTASLRTENPVVQSWIEGRQQELRSALAQQGLRLDWLDVAITPDGRRDAHPERHQQGRQGRPSKPSHGARFEIDV